MARNGWLDSQIDIKNLTLKYLHRRKELEAMAVKAINGQNGLSDNFQVQYRSSELKIAVAGKKMITTFFY